MKSHPYFIVGWLWFLGTLVPVIGFVQVGTQSMADRYTYSPLIGLFIIIAWGIPDKLFGWRYKKTFLFTSSFCVLLIFWVMTKKQLTYWKDGLMLSRRAVDVTSDNWLMENNLANMLVRRGPYSQSIPHHIEALWIKPDEDMTYKNMVAVLKITSTKNSIAENMESVLSLYPKDASLYFVTVKMYRDEHKSEQAIIYLEKTIQKINNLFLLIMNYQHSIC